MFGIMGKGFNVSFEVTHFFSIKKTSTTANDCWTLHQDVIMEDGNDNYENNATCILTTLTAGDEILKTGLKRDDSSLRSIFDIYSNLRSFQYQSILKSLLKFCDVYWSFKMKFVMFNKKQTLKFCDTVDLKFFTVRKITLKFYY
jgi:hypothetical protein